MRCVSSRFFAGPLLMAPLLLSGGPAAAARHLRLQRLPARILLSLLLSMFSLGRRACGFRLAFGDLANYLLQGTMMRGERGGRGSRIKRREPRRARITCVASSGDFTPATGSRIPRSSRAVFS